jgi:hypothetical protein
VLAATVYGAAGWDATCLLGAGMGGAALLVWGLTQRLASYARRPIRPAAG